MPNSTSVFDSWPLMALLQDEPASQKVEALITRAHTHQTVLLISVVNLGEIWYSLARTRSAPDADTAITVIQQLGFRIVDATWETTYQAAQFKSRYRLSYADCFAAALAKREDVALVTGDR